MMNAPNDVIVLMFLGFLIWLLLHSFVLLGYSIWSDGKSFPCNMFFSKLLFLKFNYKLLSV